MKLLREFIKFEASGGILLLAAAVLALIIDNSPLQVYYQTFFNQILLSKPLLLWINDGLMSIFFFLVTLEIKRELRVGELNSFSKSILPAIAALGGMVAPAIIYIIFNWGDITALRGWAIPSATDIAFSLAILSLLTGRVPTSLRVFLMALAIFDDIGAIIIIAIFYTENISLILLLLAGALLLILFSLNYFKIKKLSPYFLVGIILWLCVLKSGVHATIAGVLLALAVPLDRVEKIEHRLHPWVAFGVLPVFAFANAGVSFAGMNLQLLLSPITLGIAAGLFVGKQLGITGVTWLCIKGGLSSLPQAANWRGIYGISLIGGVGFTMSLFIGTLAFGNLSVYPAMIRLGVMMGSLLSGVLGYLILRFARIKRG